MYQLDELLHDPIAPPLVHDVYSSLLRFTTGNVSAEKTALHDSIQQWSQEYSRMRSTLVFADRLESKISALTAERRALLQEKKELRQALTANKRVLMAKESKVQKLGAELLSIYQSRWWRWSQPLRTLLSRFRRPI
jgi:hypothetical protein